MSFRCAGAVFRELLQYNAVRVSEACVLKRLPWNARASVCSSVVFVGPVVQSARFDLLPQRTFRANSIGHVTPRTLHERRVNFGWIESLWCDAHFITHGEPSAHFGWKLIRNCTLCFITGFLMMPLESCCKKCSFFASSIFSRSGHCQVAVLQKMSHQQIIQLLHFLRGLFKELYKELHDEL